MIQNIIIIIIIYFQFGAKKTINKAADWIIKSPAGEFTT